MHPLTHTHLLFCLHTVSSRADVTGNVGTDITLNFTFRPNVSLTKNSHFAIYRNITAANGEKKIAEYTKGKEGDVFDVYPKNTSVSWRITNLKLNDSGSYWASLFKEPGPAIRSIKVQLTVREVNRRSTGRL